MFNLPDSAGVLFSSWTCPPADFSSRCMTRPLPITPQDLPQYRREQGNRALFRSATCLVKAAGTNGFAERTAAELYPGDKAVPIILRAASSPNTLAGSALAGYEQADPAILAPASASAQLIGAGLRVDLAGRGLVHLPAYLISAADAGSFVQEGNPIPVRQIAFTPGPMLEPRKFAVITTFVREISEHSNLEQIIREALTRASALAFDAAIFSNTAADASRPAGILNGISSIASAGGTGQSALIGDISTIIAGFAAKGGTVPTFVGEPGTMARLRLWAPPLFDYPIWSSSAVATGTLIVVQADAFASGFDPIPLFSISSEALLHEDTAPAQIVAPGPIMPATQRSLYQTDTLALKMIVKCAWALRGGLALWMTGVNW
jgi:hypothetical protein